MAQQKLLTQEIRKKLPPLYSQDKVKDPIVQAVFFNPTGSGYWLATEFDGEDTFFGFAEIHAGCGELGYFSLSELESIRVRGGLKIERDAWWDPKPLSEAKKEKGIG